MKDPKAVSTGRPSGWQLGALLLSVIIYVFVNLYRVAVPGAVFNELQSSLNASAIEITALGSIFLYVYALAQPFSGICADRFGGLRTILAGGGILAAGSILFAVAPSLWLLYVARGLVGLGSAAIYLSLVKLLDRYYPEKFSLMLGILLVVGYSGGIGQCLVAKITVSTSWRTAFLGSALLLLAAWIGFALCTAKAEKAPITKESFSLRPIWEILTEKKGLSTLTVASVSFSLYSMFLIVVGPKYLRDCRSFSASEAALTASLMVVFSAGGNFFTGAVSSLCGNRRKPLLWLQQIASLLGCVFLLGGGILHWHTASILAGLFCYSFASGFTPVTTGILRDISPENRLGAAASCCNCFAYLMVSILVSLSGVVMEFLGGDAVVKLENAVIYPERAYIGLFLMTLLLQGFCAVLVIGLPETWGKHWNAPETC